MDKLIHDEVTIFTGVARSGTTFLGDLANRFLDVAAVNEGNFESWLDAQVASEASLADERSLGELLDRLARHEYFQLMYAGDVPPPATLAARLRGAVAERTLEGVALAVLKVTRQYLGRGRLGHEDPRLMDNLSGLMRVLPRCRIVHIIRDPRDVATSILKFPWGANNPAIAAMRWDSQVAEARALGRCLGPGRYRQIRYEDLLLYPAETMASLMRFVRGTVDAELLDRFVAEMEANPRRGNSGTWRRGLSPRQVESVEGIAARQMRALGYQPETAARAPSWAARSFWRLHHRAIQAKGIVMGRLSVAGGAKLELSPVPGERQDTPVGTGLASGPSRDAEVAQR